MSAAGLDDMVGKTCPQTGFLNGGDRSAFTLDGVEYKVVMTDLRGSCKYKSDNRVIVKTAFTVGAQAGDEKAVGQKISIPYVAAVLDDQENIIARQNNIAKIEITGTGQGLTTEEFEQTIPYENAVKAARMKVIYSFANR